MDIPTYIDQLRTRFADLDDEEREAILVEIRDYLDQESELMRNRYPGLDKPTAVEQTIQAFGDPHDIALIIDSNHDLISVVDSRTQEHLLDIPTMSGAPRGRVFSSSARAMRAIIKYRGFNVLGILALAAILLAVASVLDRPDQPVQGDVAIDPLYQYHQEWTLENPASGRFSEALDVDDSIASWSLHLDIDSEQGCVQILVRSLGGAVEHDTGLVCDGDALTSEREFTESGQWTMEYRYTDFVGVVDVRAMPAS